VSIIRFLRDRIPVMLLFAGSSAVVVMFLWLALRMRSVFLSAADILYIFALKACALCAYLAYDYIRHRPLYRQLRQLESGGGMENAIRVTRPVTGEEERLVRALHDLHNRYSTQLLEQRRAQELHLEYVQLWVHQMKTPLSVVDLLLQNPPAAAGPGSGDESLRRTPNADQAEEQSYEMWLASLGEETERLSEGLDMMLHSARLGRFESDLHLRRVELVPLLRECVNERKTAFIHSGVYPRITAEPERIEVETDAKWLRFVLHQLISNALKYSRLTGRTGLYLDVRAVREGSRVRLDVRDNGVGIPPEDLPRIFDPFFTGENGRRTNQATGMGLYLVKQVCDRLGHGLGAESRPGEGTTVTVWFETKSITKLEED